MEHHLELKSISRNQQILGKAEKILSPQVSQSKKVGDRLKSEKFNLSYADLHHEITKSVDNILPKSLGNHLKQRVEGKATEDEELVKYMSNLPSYLERRENFQEKALSFGVLDWGRLEKWQYDHKQIPNKSGRHSSSSSNSSSLFSTDESSTHSSGGHSCSPTRQRIRRPTLQSHLKASPAEGFSEGVKFFGGNAGKFQDLNAPSGTPFSGQQRFIKTNQSSCQIQSEIKLEKCKINSSNPKASAEMRTSTNLENFAHSPRDLPKNGHSGLSQLPGSSAARGSTEAPQRSFSERSNSTKVHSAKLYSGIPHSCPLPCDVDSSKASQIKQPSSMDVGSIKVPFDASVCPTNLVRSKNPEEKKPTIVPTNSTAREPSEGSDLKKGTVAAAKVRNSSPTRRFSISMSRIIRSSSSKDGMAIPPLSSSHVDTKSGPDRAMAACMDRNSHQFPEPLQKDSTSIDRSYLSSKEQLDSSNSRSGKKHGSLPMQALLQVAVKNGLPLFTFAVDGDKDILAATMRKSWLHPESIQPEGISCSDGCQDPKREHWNQDHFITKVILPSGVHSLPNKGEPSRLLERWKSGGSCDCGGWDMGCKLRVLVNQNQHRKKPSPPTTDRFELFSLEGVEADEPIFSMSSFKDGIYSAEFSSPLSLLQAFSICIAVLNSRTQPSEMSNPSEERSDGIIKAPNQVQGEAAARYVSYPPLSPVGRV
ncbi:unnamed protein product, partial [Vitis vinifera]